MRKIHLLLFTPTGRHFTCCTMVLYLLVVPVHLCMTTFLNVELKLSYFLSHSMNKSLYTGMRTKQCYAAWLLYTQCTLLVSEPLPCIIKMLYTFTGNTAILSSFVWRCWAPTCPWLRLGGWPPPCWGPRPHSSGTYSSDFWTRTSQIMSERSESWCWKYSVSSDKHLNEFFFGLKCS